MTEYPTLKQPIDNDFHPDDLGLSAERDDAWGNLADEMIRSKIDMDVKEKNAGTRFHDSGERIPGRQKAANDRGAKEGRPALIKMLGPGR